ncbi:MAG: hypothetical protein GY809_28510 [Planctomycetes bacterium]|nr:hypothetical protein [Planctomycetota bacterium]
MTEIHEKQHWIQRMLGHNLWPLAMAVLAMVTCVPALWSGLFNDDFLQRAELMAPTAAHQALAQVNLEVNRPGDLGTCLPDLFVAVAPQKNRTALLEYGALPWWTGPNYRVALLRPAATFTHWIDTHWLGDSLVWMHAHNVIWLGLIMFMAGVVYRGFMPLNPMTVGLGLLLLALDTNHYFPTLWIANRNQLMALFFALVSLSMHHHWRVNKAPHAAILSAAGLLASLLSAEAGVATFAFLFAYALCLDTSPWAKRVLSLVPAFGLIVAWRLVYSHLGYGAQGGGFYIDPAGQPVAFAQAALQRAAFLLAGQWYAIPPDLFSFFHDTARWPFTLVLWGLLAAAVAMCGPLLRHNRTARFWCVAMGVAIVPVCAAVPMGRNLLFASIAGFALIAQLIHGALTRAAWLPETRSWRWLIMLTAGVLITVHGVFGLVLIAAMPGITGDMMTQLDATSDLNDPDIQNGQDVVIINAPNPASMLYVPYKRALTQLPLPGLIHMLAPGYGPMQVSRPNDQSLRIRALEASLLTCRATPRLEIVHLYRYLSEFRQPQDRLIPGEPIRLRGLTVTIESMDTEGHPVDVLCEFDSALTSPTRTWLKWDWEGEHYAPFRLPEIGEMILIKGPY